MSPLEKAGAELVAQLRVRVRVTRPPSQPLRLVTCLYFPPVPGMDELRVCTLSQEVSP